MKKEKPEAAVVESPYVDAFVFQQAICSECEKLVVVQTLRFFADTDEQTGKEMLEQFAMDAHNSLVRSAGLLCVTPKLVVFYGHARVLADRLAPAPAPSIITEAPTIG